MVFNMIAKYNRYNMLSTKFGGAAERPFSGPRSGRDRRGIGPLNPWTVRVIHEALALLIQAIGMGMFLQPYPQRQDFEGGNGELHFSPSISRSRARVRLATICCTWSARLRAAM